MVLFFFLSLHGEEKHTNIPDRLKNIFSLIGPCHTLVKNKAPTKRMILLFHNILNKVTSSTLTWIQKTLAASFRPQQTAKFKHSGYKWPDVLCTVARQTWGTMLNGKKTEKWLKYLSFFSLDVKEWLLCHCLTLEAMSDWNDIKNSSLKMITQNLSFPTPLLEG